MALGFYRAEYFGTKYFFKGVEEGFCCGYKNYWCALKEYIPGHQEDEITNRILLVPHKLLTFNTETE